MFNDLPKKKSTLTDKMPSPPMQPTQRRLSKVLWKKVKETAKAHAKSGGEKATTEPNLEKEDSNKTYNHSQSDLSQNFSTGQLAIKESEDEFSPTKKSPSPFKRSQTKHNKSIENLDDSDQSLNISVKNSIMKKKVEDKPKNTGILSKLKKKVTITKDDTLQGRSKSESTKDSNQSNIMIFNIFRKT